MGPTAAINCDINWVIAPSLTFNAAVSFVHVLLFSRLGYNNCAFMFAGLPGVMMENLRRWVMDGGRVTLL